MDNEACPICGTIPYDSDRRVLVVGARRRSYCSQACLRTGVRLLQMARRQAWIRGGAIALSLAIIATGALYVRHLLMMRRAQPAPVAAAAPAPAAPPEPTPFGPHWPPTDEEWLAEFTHASWVYPLPGPTRRRPASSRQLFFGDAADKVRAVCRSAGRCAVDVGGELWGEHVYVAHDGVIDRLQRSSEDTPGGVYVRIAHWGGAVFTQYFHLAAVPLHLAVGMHVSAGDVIGLAGDTGLTDGRTHLHFALSVRPSSSLPEVYWDPEPLMAAWPLRTPERGSVAGVTNAVGAPERLAGDPPVRRRP